MFEFSAYRHLQKKQVNLCQFRWWWWQFSQRNTLHGNHKIDKQQLSFSLFLTRSFFVPHLHSFIPGPASGASVRSQSVPIVVFVRLFTSYNFAMISTPRPNNKAIEYTFVANHLQRMENKLTFTVDNGHHETARKLLIEMILFVPTRCEWLRKREKSCCYDNNRQTKDDKAGKKKNRMRNWNVIMLSICEWVDVFQLGHNSSTNSRYDNAIEEQ